MASDLVKELIEAGIHFGHKASRWNPKMLPYILGKRSTVHLIDIKKTIKGLLQAKKFVSQVVSRGEDVLFVGTKRQARSAVKAAAQKSDMHFVIERWLGGTLTNFRTIRSRLSRLEELENLEETGQLFQESKKTISRLSREKRKIHRNLEGIRKMSKLPGVLVIIDAHHEHIAIAEARKLKIPTVCLIDTDSDPDLVDIPIPGNDDAIRVIELILNQIVEAIEVGKRAQPPAGEQVASNAPQPRRRSRRPSTSQLAAAESASSDDQDESGASASQGHESSDAMAVANVGADRSDIADSDNKLS